MKRAKTSALNFSFAFPSANAAFPSVISPFAPFIAAALFVLLCASATDAHSSQAWKKRIDARTATIWIEGQDIGGIILNARGELNITLLERELLHELDADRDVEEWVVANLAWYSANRKETRAKMKGRDVLVLNYRAVKYWNFDPTCLVVDGRAVVSDDILTKEEFWAKGELAPGTTGTVALAVPSAGSGKKKSGRSLEFRYGDDRALLEFPPK